MTPSTPTSTPTPTTSAARRLAVAGAAVAAVAAAACLVAGAASAASGVDRIYTVAGLGTQGFSGDGGQATSAQLNYPAGGAVDAQGNLYIADNTNDRIRKVSPAGVITTVAGDGIAGYGGDGGQATSARLDFPDGVAVDPHGDLFIADTLNNRVREVSPSGVITTVAGNGIAGYSGDGGQATSAELDNPTGVAVGPEGVLYIADEANERVREVHANGLITTVAGTGVIGFSGDGGPAGSAELNTPASVATDAQGDLYIADASNWRVRKVDASGTITTIAGNGIAGFSGDGGQATSAEISFPRGVAVDPAGNVYIADLNNYRVRKVTPDGRISSIAGNGLLGFSGDGGQALSAELGSVLGVATDAGGDVFVFDSSNQRVREVVNVPPTPSFSQKAAANDPNQIAFDASASADPDGSITAYSWTFGDGQGGSGETATHTYAQAGTYSATLTATDDSGATAATTAMVVVTSPPVPPTPQPGPQPPVKSTNPTKPTLAMTLLAPGSEHALRTHALTLESACSLACAVSSSARIVLDGVTLLLPIENVRLRGGGQGTLRIPLSVVLRRLIAEALADGARPVARVTLLVTSAADPLQRVARIAVVA
jgi:sugar lactone lactonase YvrE